jgi:hypothetical protein
VSFESLAELKACPETVKFGISIDVADAYHHLKLDNSIGKYFQFRINDKFYQCVGLPFGWNGSPAAFTKFLRPVLAAIRSPSKLMHCLPETY